MNRKLLIFALCAALATSWCRADYNGTVSEVKHFRNGGVAIDLDGKFPNQQMVLYIAPANVAKFTTLPHEGDVVKAIGKESKYKGRRQIVLTGPGQIEVS